MTAVTFAAPKRPVSRVFLHCSASDNPAHDNVETIRQWHLARGFSDVGYHYVVTQDGTPHPARPLDLIPAAQERNNTGTVAICLTGLAHFTEAQFDTLRALCQAIHAELPLATFHGHCEVSAKSCPVYDYRAVLGLNARGELT